jgi:hypothetical protein
MITDTELEQQNSQIANALAEAERQRALRANRDDAATAAAIDRMQNPQIASAYQVLRSALHEHGRLPAWASIKQAHNSGQPPEFYAESRVRAALAMLDDALGQISARSGERVASTRNWLNRERDRVAAALNAFESVGANLSGQGALVLIGRIDAARLAFARANEAVHLADRDTADEANRELERCEAEFRSIDRAVADLYAALAVPSLPDAKTFAEARAATIDLARRAGKKPGIVDQHHAMDLGRDASPNAARLWIIYETEPHALIDLRWARYAARAT